MGDRDWRSVAKVQLSASERLDLTDLIKRCLLL